MAAVLPRQYDPANGCRGRSGGVQRRCACRVSTAGRDRSSDGFDGAKISQGWMASVASTFEVPVCTIDGFGSARSDCDQDRRRGLRDRDPARRDRSTIDRCRPSHFMRMRGFPSGGYHLVHSWVHAGAWATMRGSIMPVSSGRFHRWIGKRCRLLPPTATPKAIHSSRHSCFFRGSGRICVNVWRCLVRSDPFRRELQGYSSSRRRQPACPAC